MRHPGLLREPLPRRGDIGHPLPAGEHMTLLDAALRPEFARAVTVRQQHRVAGLQELFGPVAVARQHRFGMPTEAAAAVQRDHGGKRSVTLRLVELRVQGQVG